MNWVRKDNVKPYVNLLLTTIAAVMVAVGANILTMNEPDRQRWIPAGFRLDILLIVGSLVPLAFQLWLSFQKRCLPEKALLHFLSSAAQALDDRGRRILESHGRAGVDPNVRGYFYLHDPRAKCPESSNLRGVLIPIQTNTVSQYLAEAKTVIPCPNDKGDIPTQWWIATQAFWKREVVVGDVNWGNKPSNVVDGRVALDVKVVIAIPIQPGGTDRNPPIGIVTFVSHLTKKELDWDDDRLKNTLAALGVAFYHAIRDEPQSKS